MPADAAREQPHPRRDLVVIGASAGGVEVLSEVVRDLPGDLHAAVCIVLHIAPSSPSMLARILDRAGALPCRTAQDGERLREGVVLVAPPDHHLVVEDGHVRLTAGPRENGHRPAIDVLFRSAAEVRDKRVVGVVVSGTRDDGSAGLAVIKANGGVAIVQDPDDALYAGMPASAIANVAVDAIVPSTELGSTIAAMVNGDDLSPGAPSEHPADPDPPARESEQAGSPAAPFDTICPECGGLLSERRGAPMLQWECRVGHRYSPDTLVDAQGDSVEGAVWAAIRALEDRAMLLGRMARQADRRGQSRSARHFRRQAESASEQAKVVRQALPGVRSGAREVIESGEELRNEQGAA